MPVSNVHYAKTNLSKLIDAALRGEEVIIARHGAPKVRLVPLESEVPSDREGGWLEGRAKILRPDWQEADPEMERLFYESTLFPPADDDAVA